jgi:hypothetical protein
MTPTFYTRLQLFACLRPFPAYRVRRSFADGDNQPGTVLEKPSATAENLNLQ